MEDIFEVLMAVIVIAAGGIISAMQKRRKAESKSFQSSTPHPYAASEQEKPAAPASKPAPFPDHKPLERQPLAPTVHVHLEPDCEIHDQPGSLGAVSDEGKDPCHEEQLNAAPAAASVSAAPARPGLKLEWTGDSMVKAFVMQEILARPCQRRR